jgi:Spy/CpxP family protein refolding chaperone
MRKFVLVMLLALSAGACAEDATAPEPQAELLEEAAVLAYGAMDMADPGSRFIARLHSLPDRLQLTAEQIEAIRALIQAYQEATAADKEALAAIHQEAREAKQAGASAEEIRAILARGHEIRLRLHAAERQLRADIMAVLTPAQIRWLAGHYSRFCSPENVQLTEDQKTQITALVVAFELAHRADLQAIKEVFEAAREARQAGASREEIAAILAQAREPMQRIREAQAALEAAIRALLTPAQLACYGRWGPHR